MVFKPSIKQDVFEFQVSGSKKTFSIPLRQYISADLVDRMTDAAMPLQSLMVAQKSGAELTEADLPEPEKIVELGKITRELFDRYAPGAYESASQAEINAIVQEWGRLSNIDMGESSASSSS